MYFVAKYCDYIHYIVLFVESVLTSASSMLILQVLSL